MPCHCPEAGSTAVLAVQVMPSDDRKLLVPEEAMATNNPAAYVIRYQALAGVALLVQISPSGEVITI